MRTQKVIDAIASTHEITLIDAAKTQNFNLTDFDIIGFASGIYYSKFHKSILQFALDNLPVNNLYTYGAKKIDTQKPSEI